MAVLGFVIAGVVALMQILGNATPKREMRLLIKRRELFGYFAFLSVLLVVIALGCWVSAFPGNAQAIIGASGVHFFVRGTVLFGMLALSVAGLFVFAYLTFKSRKLLDDRAYVAQYVHDVSPAKVRTYLAAIYGTGADLPRRPSAKQKASIVRKQFERSQDVYDPFQPIREYVKVNALNSFDYGTASGLKFFSRLFDKTLDAIVAHPQPDEFYYAARYMAESCSEFFSIFEKTASEKRRMDIVRLLYSKGEMLLEHGSAEGLLTIVHGMEEIARASGDDDEIIAVLMRIRALADSYLDYHKHAKWSDIAPIFEEICLSVARISESYYLQKDTPFRTMPAVAYATGENRTVTTTLIEFFQSYHDLADRYTDIYPVSFFVAIEGVTEALFVQLAGVVQSGREHIGLNRVYTDMVTSLCRLYGTFGIDAIEHNKPELLALCLTNLRRLIKPARYLKLASEHQILVNIFLELTLNGVRDLGDIKLKGERTISMYAIETLKKHAKTTDITEGLNVLSEAGFDVKLAELKPVVEQLKKI